MIEQAALSCEPLGGCQVLGIEGNEAIGSLSHFSVDVLAATGDCDLEALIDEQVELGLVDNDGGKRTLSLQVTKARFLGQTRDGYGFRLDLMPRLFPLTLRSGYRIWQDKTTQQIVNTIVEELGLSSSEISWRLTGQYAKRGYCVQYGETEWAFVSRLLCDDGINIWFDSSDSGPLVVFGDAGSAHASISGEHHVRYEDPSGLEASATAIFDLSYACELSHDAVHVRDFDVRQPDVLIEGKAGKGSLEHYEFPANVLNAEQAEARAKARLDQLQRLSVRLSAKSGNARLQPGRIITIEGACDPLFHGDFLVVSVSHRLQQASPHAVNNKPYRNEALLVPHGGERTFRPALPQQVPRIDGIETAVVTGTSGDEITVSDLGEIRARFRWDRSGVQDDKSSRWIRCLQMMMGGSMLLPRVGWEVPIVYVDGNPDHPFVLGRLYNSSSPAPYGQPGKSATSTLQSATSPADGTTQEIRMADDAGAMEVFIHATKDQTVNVGGNQAVSVAANETHDVKKSAGLKVDGAQTATVAGDQSVVVGANATLTVKGARDESIGGMESIGVKGSYNLTVAGAYTEGVGAAYGIECNQSNTVIQGSFTQLIGGSMIQVAGLGTNQSCAAARLEDVGGARTIVAGFSVADSVVGTKTISAGASKDSAKADIVTSVGGVGLIKVGGSAKFEAGGPLAIEAPRIKIKAGGSITAKGGSELKIGGKVESTGKTKFDASKTHKKSTSKVG